MTVTPALQAAVLAAVRDCPHRGGVLPHARQPEGCVRCGELSACAAGRGAEPGAVTLADCVGCRYERLYGATP